MKWEGVRDLMADIVDTVLEEILALSIVLTLFLFVMRIRLYLYNEMECLKEDKQQES